MTRDYVTIPLALIVVFTLISTSFIFAGLPEAQRMAKANQEQTVSWNR